MGVAGLVVRRYTIVACNGHPRYTSLYILPDSIPIDIFD